MKNILISSLRVAVTASVAFFSIIFYAIVCHILIPPPIIITSKIVCKILCLYSGVQWCEISKKLFTLETPSKTHEIVSINL